MTITRVNVTTGEIEVLDEVVNAIQQSREEFRLTASMAKHAFCILMADLGVLTDDEAISAAKGDWPASFDAAIADLPDVEQRNARVLWAATIVVNRSDPLLERLRPHANLTPEQLDEMFGYVG